MSSSGVSEEEVQEMREYVDNMRYSWAETGCSILLDGWKDAKGRSSINVFVACSRGTVYLMSYDSTEFLENTDTWLWFVDLILMLVGIKPVVQIIINSTSTFLKDIGKQVMQKYRTIFWTVSASCCIELMLEKIRKLDLIEETLDKVKFIAWFINKSDVPLRDLKEGITEIGSVKSRSTVPFLILENIILKQNVLKILFCSSNSMSLKITSTTEGKRITNFVGDHLFWKTAEYVLYATIPLVRIMELMNENKVVMGNIYETMDQVKEEIKKGLGKMKSDHKPFWNVIDGVWNEHLHNALHSGGYFLNPTIFYTKDLNVDSEVTIGLVSSIFRTIEDLHVGDCITNQLEEYRKANGPFAEGCQEENIPKPETSPEPWWIEYGGKCPELRRFAVRILSQTIDGASKFQINKSLAETFLTNAPILLKQNPIEYQISRDTLYVQYNRKLRNFPLGVSIESDEINLIAEWIEDNAHNCGQS